MTDYRPIVKTTDAEIKGYEKLDSAIKSSFTPIFELTRSRPLKGFPSGDIHKRMSQLGEFSEGNGYILDVTGHEDLMNEQIEDLLDDSNGFKAWRDFLKKYKSHRITPMLHLYDEDLSTYKTLARYLSDDYGQMAFRATADTSKVDLRRYLDELVGIVEFSDQYTLILDGEYVSHKTLRDIENNIFGLALVASEYGIKNISLNCSSFPASVVAHPQGKDHEGNMDMLELQFFKNIQSELDSSETEIGYGDYGSIHPVRSNVRGGSWVPRIDLSLEASYIYKRYRRDEGSYVRAARELIDWELYSPIDCWAKQQIEKAAEGEPEGRSPAYWISARLNQHLTKMSILSEELV